jgi:hypothetical protein
MSPNLLHSATIFLHLLTRSDKTELEFWFAHAYRVVKYRKNGAPDTIRTCDLCLRRATVLCRQSCQSAAIAPDDGGLDRLGTRSLPVLVSP